MGFAVTSYADGAVGILSASIISLDQGLNSPDSETALDSDKYRYQLFLDPAEKIDTKTLNDYINPINNNKSDIQGLGQWSVWDSNEKLYSSVGDANDAIDNLYGVVSQKDGLFSQKQIIQVIYWVGTPSSGFGSLATPSNPVTSGSFSAGDTVTQDGGGSGRLLENSTITAGVSGRLIIEQVDGDFNSGSDNVTVGAATSIITSVSDVKYVGEATIYEDVMLSHVYPAVEPTVQPGNDDIFGNATNKIITSSTKGQGIGNTFYQNGLNTTPSSPSPVLGVFVNCDGGVPSIGKVYTFDTSSASSNAASISSKKDEIQTKREGTGSPQTSVAEFAGAASVVKEQKQSYAVNVWSGERMKVVMNDDKTSYETAIAVLTNPGFQ